MDVGPLKHAAFGCAGSARGKEISGEYGLGKRRLWSKGVGVTL